MSSRPDSPTRWTEPAMRARLRRRHRAERSFQLLGLSAIVVAGLALAVLLVSIFASGWSAFVQTRVALDVHFDADRLAPLAGLSGDALESAANQVDWAALIRESLMRRFPEFQTRREIRELQRLVSVGARTLLRDRVLGDAGLAGRTLRIWLPAASEVDLAFKGEGSLEERPRRWLDALERDGRVETAVNLRFLRSGDSREPELAGIGGALIGSLFTLLVTLATAFPLGVAAAVYLEEFAPRHRLTDLIEVNINNLAAVPSIVFGLLGLAVFLNVMHLPRSAPLVGGLTLALMTLPTIIIAGRSAIQAVPPSIREAARGLGASPVQVVTHHVLPLAMPGILTGTIIGMARALGETAPLLMIGMVAFVVDVPGGFTDASTALPVQVYLWADSPERGFVEKVSGAIIVLLGFLVLMNGAAVMLRQKFERRW